MDPNLRFADSVSRFLAHGAIRCYQLTFSSVFGRHCRHTPSCSAYMDEAISRYGAWPGTWMGAARLWRCRPFGTSGYDPIPERLPTGAAPATPWRYGRWKGPLICEAAREHNLAGASAKNAP